MARGLDALAGMDTIIIKQKINGLTAWEVNNRYAILSPDAQYILYLAREQTGSWERECMGSARAFKIALMDKYGQQELMSYRRMTDECCEDIQFVECSGARMGKMGRIDQVRTWTTPKFTVQDSNGTVIFNIKGPMITGSFVGNEVDFDILSPDCQKVGKIVDFDVSSTDCQKVGKITKLYRGFLTEFFTDANSFRLEYPPGIDLKMKGTLLGAVFMLDFTYYES